MRKRRNLMLKRPLLPVVWCFAAQALMAAAAAETARDPFRLPVMATPPSAPAAVSAQPAAHSLIGVVIAGHAAAIFRNRQDGRIKVLRVGEKIDHRRIRRIDLDGVSYDEE